MDTILSGSFGSCFRIWSSGAKRHAKPCENRINRRYGVNALLFGDLAQGRSKPVGFGNSRFFCEIPYFWRASFGLFRYHLLSIIDELIATGQYSVPIFSEKTGQMVRKLNPENVARGEILAQYRERNGETQQVLADAIGKERVTIGAYEKGRAGMPADVREAVCERYSIPLDKMGLDLPKAGELPQGSQDAAMKLALYILKTTEDPEARKLAFEAAASLAAIKI